MNYWILSILLVPHFTGTASALDTKVVETTCSQTELINDSIIKNLSSDINDIKKKTVPSCLDGLTIKDKKLFDEFLEKASKLKSDEVQLQKLIETYLNQLPPSALNTISAIYLREQFLQLANGLKNDSEINKAYQEFNEATEKHIDQRKIYEDSGLLSRMSGSADEAFANSGNRVVEKMNKLIGSIKVSSKIDDIYKRQIIDSLLKMQSREFGTDAYQASKAVERYTKYAAAAKTVRDGAAGAALIVGGIVTAGATTSAGLAVMSSTASLGATESFLVGFVASAATASAAGAAIGGGFELLTSEVGIMWRSMVSDDSFMCSLVEEQSRHSKDIYVRSLKVAALGAFIGAGRTVINIEIPKGL